MLYLIHLFTYKGQITHLRDGYQDKYAYTTQ